MKENQEAKRNSDPRKRFAGHKKIPLLVIVGPTAVGKTAVAVEVAKKIDGEIVSADSAQIYRYLDIGTAKPSKEENNLAVHHLIDILDPKEEFSVAQFQKLANQCIEDIYAREKHPILVGGTGLYVNAVIDAYSFFDRGKNEQTRQWLQLRADNEGLEQLYQELQRLDPEAAHKISINDGKRIIRALEVYYTEGQPISQQEKYTSKTVSPFHLLPVGLHMPREELYRRINERVDRMIVQGLLEEVEELLEYYPTHARGLQILGYCQMVKYLQGEVNWEEAVGEIKQETRRLAKRQLTWFRRDHRIVWVEVKPQAISDSVNTIYNLWKDKLYQKAN